MNKKQDFYESIVVTVQGPEHQKLAGNNFWCFVGLSRFFMKLLTLFICVSLKKSIKFNEVFHEKIFWSISS